MNHKFKFAFTKSLSSQAVRKLSVQQSLCAGFQGSQNVSIAYRQSAIDRKKRKIAKLEKQGLNEIPIIDFYIPYSWRQPDR